ncbi:MAG: hypothetical protein KAU95_04595 [Candidatus Aenigmarchaeota archaeon]|nr:hypothetical protein [Candidatus Aenigmarchaeota archaeon]
MNKMKILQAFSNIAFWKPSLQCNAVSNQKYNKELVLDCIWIILTIICGACFSLISAICFGKSDLVIKISGCMKILLNLLSKITDSLPTISLLLFCLLILLFLLSLNSTLEVVPETYGEPETLRTERRN